MPSLPVRRILKRVATLGAVLGVAVPSLMTPTTASAVNFTSPGLTPARNSPYFQNPAWLTATTTSATTIQIYQLSGNALQPTTGTRVARCTNTTVCSYSPPAQPGPTFLRYQAYIAPDSTTLPQTYTDRSQIASVAWSYYRQSVELSGGEVPFPGTSRTLYATTHFDIGPTPYYIEIFDVVTGQEMASCGFGSICALPLPNFLSSPEYFQGYLTTFTQVPPTSYQGVSNWRVAPAG